MIGRDQALVVWKNASIGFCALAAGAFAIGFVLPWLPTARAGVWPRLPNFPLNHLIRKNPREMLSTLDFWCSALVSALSLGFRSAGLLPGEALLPLTILVMLAISTYAQTLFGLGWRWRNDALPPPAHPRLADPSSQRCVLPFDLRAGNLAFGSRCWSRSGSVCTHFGPSRFDDSSQQSDTLAVHERSVLRYEHFPGSRDVHNRRCDPCDTAPALSLRRRLCVVYLVVRTRVRAKATVTLAHVAALPWRYKCQRLVRYLILRQQLPKA